MPGFTVPEVVVAASSGRGILCSIFEVNGLCLRFISASKENVGAIEMFTIGWSSCATQTSPPFTTVSSMKSLLAQPQPIRRPCAKKASRNRDRLRLSERRPTITYTRAINGTVSSVPATGEFLRLHSPSGRRSEPVASYIRPTGRGPHKHQLLSHKELKSEGYQRTPPARIYTSDSGRDGPRDNRSGRYRRGRYFTESHLRCRGQLFLHTFAAGPDH